VGGELGELIRDRDDFLAVSSRVEQPVDERGRAFVLEGGLTTGVEGVPDTVGVVAAAVLHDPSGDELGPVTVCIHSSAMWLVSRSRTNLRMALPCPPTVLRFPGRDDGEHELEQDGLAAAVLEEQQRRWGRPAGRAVE
jgi:hypothetical protein